MAGLCQPSWQVLHHENGKGGGNERKAGGDKGCWGKAAPREQRWKPQDVYGNRRLAESVTAGQKGGRNVPEGGGNRAVWDLPWAVWS